jgi:hypothetical protein
VDKLLNALGGEEEHQARELGVAPVHADPEEGDGAEGAGLGLQDADRGGDDDSGLLIRV